MGRRIIKFSLSSTTTYDEMSYPDICCLYNTLDLRQEFCDCCGGAGLLNYRVIFMRANGEVIANINFAM